MFLFCMQFNKNSVMIKFCQLNLYEIVHFMSVFVHVDLN